MDNLVAELFAGVQKEFVTKLQNIRNSTDHSVLKGSALEEAWKGWLSTYLPHRHCVDKAQIIDSNGAKSEEIDLVIYDRQYTPFILHRDSSKYIPAEAVYAVFEVKTDLQGELLYVAKKIASVRRLLRTSVEIVDRGISKPPRPLSKILGGILASVSTWKRDATLVKNLKKISEVSTLGTIDIGCAADQYSFYVRYEADEPVTGGSPQDQILGYYQSRRYRDIVISKPSQSMVAFFLQLSRCLQQEIGTVAAIDFEAYADSMHISLEKASSR